MSYTPPLNGGRINVTMAGNSTSAGAGYALASTGTLTLAGGNNITLSQNANAITISGGAGGGGVALYDGANSITSGTANFSDSNGVSFGINGQTVTGSVAAQTNQTIGLYGLGNTTQNSSTTLDARTLSFNGLGINTVGYSNGSIQISASQSVQTQNLADISIAGNSTSAGGGYALISSGTAIFAGGNNVTLSQNAQSITISAAAQTNQTVGLYALGNTTQNSSTTRDARTLSFNGLGIITAGYSNGSIQLSATQSNQSVGLYAGSNTTVNTSGTADARSVTFAGAGGVSIEATNGSLVISGGAGAFSAGISTGGNTLGTSGTVSNALVFAGGNNITLSQSTGGGGNTMTISAPNFATATAPWAEQFAGNSTSAGGGYSTISSGTIQWAGGNNITLSQNAQSITISAGNDATQSSWEAYQMNNTGTGALSAQTASSGSASFVPYILPVNVAGGFANLVQSMSFVTGGTSSFSQTATMNYALYTRGTGANSTSLSQLTSGSWSYAVSYNNSTMTLSYPTTSATSGYGYGSTSSNALAVSSLFTGYKLLQLPINSTLTAGNYWLGLFERASSAGFNSGLRYSYIGNNVSNILNSLAPIGQLSANFSTGTVVPGGQGNMMPGFAVFSSAAQTNLPASVGLSALTHNMSIIPYIRIITN